MVEGKGFEVLPLRFRGNLHGIRAQNVPDLVKPWPLVAPGPRRAVSPAGSAYSIVEPDVADRDGETRIRRIPCRRPRTSRGVPVATAEHDLNDGPTGGSAGPAIGATCLSTVRRFRPVVQLPIDPPRRPERAADLGVARRELKAGHDLDVRLLPSEQPGMRTSALWRPSKAAAFTSTRWPRYSGITIIRYIRMGTVDAATGCAL